MLDKLERKLGNYAIPGLMNYLIAGYIIGYTCTLLIPDILKFMTLEPYMIIHYFQFWRVITWLLIPPTSLGIFTIIMLIFYWQLGRSLETMWGTFRFNVYIIGGILITVIGAFVYYGLVYLLNGGLEITNMGGYFSTYYINMSIFLAFAMTIPDMQIYLYFLIPIKMKWLAIVYAVLILSSFVSTPVMHERVSIICSLLNFIIFFFSNKRLKGFGNNRRRTKRTWAGFSTYTSRQQGNGGNAYGGGQTRWGATNQGSTQSQKANKGPAQISRHKCAICGRTEITNPELEFRFCSKCNGNYEYCNEHLFTHSHVE